MNTAITYTTPVNNTQNNNSITITNASVTSPSLSGGGEYPRKISPGPQEQLAQVSGEEANGLAIQQTARIPVIVLLKKTVGAQQVVQHAKPENRRYRAMRKILVLLLFLVIVVFSGCVETDKMSVGNVAVGNVAVGNVAKGNIASESAVFPVEQESSLPEETSYEPLVINDTFITWSRGYWSNYSYRQPSFIVITSYDEWMKFLDEVGYISAPWDHLEGSLYPGWRNKSRTINAVDFNEHFIIAVMMGLRGHAASDEIEITNISRVNSTVNVTVHFFESTYGLTVISHPYHIVIVKREMLPVGAVFNFVDTEGRLVGVIKPVVELLYVPASVRRDANFTLRWMVSGGTPGEINYTAVHWGYRSGGVNMSDYPGASARQTGMTPQEFTADIRAPSGGRVYLRVHAIVDGVHTHTPEYQIRILTER